MNSVSQPGRKAVPGDLFSGAVSPVDIREEGAVQVEGPKLSVGSPVESTTRGCSIDAQSKTI